MILKALELKNFRSHNKTSIKFDEGITCILGENGAGKSSIFEAISFALFRATNGKLIDLIRKNTENMSVKLSFSLNNRQYTIIRTNKTSKLSLNNETIAEGHKIVNQEIETILNIDKDLFLNAIYVKQGEIAELVDKTSSERKKLIGKLFEIDQLEDIWKNIGPVITDYKTKISELQGIISNKKNIENELKRAENNSREINTLIKANKTKKDNILKDLDLANEELNKLNKKTENEKKIKDIQNKIDLLQAHNSGYENTLKKLEKKQSEIKKVDDPTLVISLFHKREELEAERDEVKKQSDIVKDLIHDFNEKPRLDQKISDNGQKHAEIYTSLSKSKAKEEIHNKEVFRLKELKDQCPQCLQTINHEEKEKIINELMQKINTLEDEIKTKEEKQDFLIQEKTKLLENFDEIQNNYYIYKEALAKTESLRDYTVIQEEIELIDIPDQYKNKDYLNKLQVDYNIYLELQRELREVPKIEEKIWDNEHEIIDYNTSINEYLEKIKNIDINDYILSTIDTLNIDLQNINNTLSTSSGQLSQVNKNILYLKKQLSNIKNNANELKRIQDYIKLLEQIREIYSKDGIQKVFREKMRPLIQKHTQTLFQQFNFDYADLSIDNDYNVALEGNSIDLISGGEKIAVALSLRLAITKAISKGAINTILLDEPTIHLDAYRRAELITFLENISILPQMIIVTHDVEIENAANNVIKIKKENGISQIVEDL